MSPIYLFQTQLKKHMRMFHIRISGEAAEEDAFVFCKECGLVMESEEDLREHRVTHRKIKYVLSGRVVEYLELGVLCRESMRLSRKKKKPGSKRGRPRPKHQCTVCEKCLSSHSALQRHKVIHTGRET